MVQNGKFALWALALDKQLKRVDFPTFGNPTIPAFIFIFFNGYKYSFLTNIYKLKLDRVYLKKY